MRQKLLIAVGSASIGGTEKQILTLCEELMKLGVECHLVFLVKGGVLESVASDLGISYTVAHLSKRNIFKTSWNLVRLMKQFNSDEYQVFYFFLPHAILFLGPLMRFLHRDKKVVYGVRGSIFRKNTLLYRLYRSELKKGNSIICNSKYLYAEIKSLEGSEIINVFTINNGVRVSENNVKDVPKSSIGNNAVVISNFHEYKGYDILLDVLSGFSFESLNLTFIGDGSERIAIFDRSQEILGHHFVFTGQVENVEEFLVNQDFAIHPSRTEGLSNAILEELANGLPVIAFNVGGNPELITNGYNGYIIEVGDLDGFAQAIRTVVSDPNKRNTFSRNAIQSVKPFSWESNAQSHLKVLFG